MTRSPDRQITRSLDALLLLMVLIWGGNYSIVKLAFREIPPLAFNAVRLAVASALFLGALALARERRPPRSDWWRLTGLAVVGHLLYQLFFALGLARTSVANSALIIGCSPVTMNLLTAIAGHERITVRQWIGIACSVAGVYLAIAYDADDSSASLAGDLLIVAAILCWAVYTVGSRALLERHSPLVVTGYSMTLGTAVYVPLAWGEVRALDWGGVSAFAWAAMIFSAVFALFVAYWIWYVAVQRVGNVRTSVYSNLVPVVGLAVGAVWLGEALTLTKLAGAAAVILGVGFMRAGGRLAPGATAARQT